jgi:hypothetical protein
MITVRDPAVAGLFYPAEASALERAVSDLLAGPPSVARSPQALIVPHAGYDYSGPVAASAYRCLQARSEPIRRVLLVGPSHRSVFGGFVVPRADAFRTPLGDVAVDPDLRARAVARDDVLEEDPPHRFEHSLEVQLPFLQFALDDVSVLPVLVGFATGDECATLIDALWTEPDTLLVVSSDLSHEHDEATARRLDMATAEAIERREPQRVDEDDACGCIGIQGLLGVAIGRGLQVERVDLRTSADTMGSPARVVGYGAFVVFEPDGDDVT